MSKWVFCVGWRDNLSTAIKMLVDYKAQPKRLAKLFNKALTEPLNEQRGGLLIIPESDAIIMCWAASFKWLLSSCLMINEYFGSLL
jgi:hypothetical protein